MRIRLPFAGLFFLLLVVAGYAGLTSLQLDGIVNDKVLHYVTFFLLTLAFYWIVDTSRRRTVNMALLVCTGGLGVGSEVLQGALPNGRVFDLFDIVANILGSLTALGLCSWYHKRMLERKRERKYTAVPGDEGSDGLVDGDENAAIDVELGEGVAHSILLHDGASTEHAGTARATPASTTASGPIGGTTAAASASASKSTNAKPPAHRSLEDEVDNWDENAEDPWDEDEGDLSGGPAKKRTD
ncbi:hypothetical protein F503_03958 [Ophiostoma piceae UAMH 11346]|uniref:VanZ-like domain-containing protein n=1 Tax=Ophiostoma piceae (strain UAMH 11346) TaxID=1262450 RepID=S3C852_OPHP1|nr:hypothetical protein F503_03958 [Ophiostoma piceae UAMH 11346]